MFKELGPLLRQRTVVIILTRLPPKFLPTTGKGILFLDELTSAPQMPMRSGRGINSLTT